MSIIVVVESWQNRPLLRQAAYPKDRSLNDARFEFTSIQIRIVAYPALGIWDAKVGQSGQLLRSAAMSTSMTAATGIPSSTSRYSSDIRA